MKYKQLIYLFAGLIIAVITNSCKKTEQSSLQSLLSGGTWQLASVQITYYTGNTTDTTVNVDTACISTQYFTFTAAKSCTYTNFDCLTQTSASASWSLTPNQLYLVSNVVCKDTTALGSSTPFINSQIINLGHYSLILLTGDIQPNYSLTAKRKTVQYGFVRQKSMGGG